MSISSRKQIIDTENFRDILDLISYDSGVFLDLDDTVIASETELGSNQWFIAIMDQALKICETEKEADELVLAICQAIHPYVKPKPVEPVIVTIIKLLQDIGIPVLALTARDYLTFDMTMKELSELRIDFSRGLHDKDKIILGDPNDRTVYQNGIIFCNGKNKGTCLELFLEKCSRQTAHVVMADDKFKHPENVKKVAERLGKRFDGMRYGHLDHKNVNLNMREANQYLAKLIGKFTPDVVEKIKRLKLLPGDFSFPETKDEMPAKIAIEDVLKTESKSLAPKPMARSLSALSLFIPKGLKIKDKKPLTSDPQLIPNEVKEKKPKPMVRSRSAFSAFTPEQRKLIPMLLPDINKMAVKT